MRFAIGFPSPARPDRGDPPPALGALAPERLSAVDFMVLAVNALAGPAAQGRTVTLAPDQVSILVDFAAGIMYMSVIAVVRSVLQTLIDHVESLPDFEDLEPDDSARRLSEKLRRATRRYC